VTRIARLALRGATCILILPRRAILANALFLRSGKGAGRAGTWLRALRRAEVTSRAVGATARSNEVGGAGVGARRARQGRRRALGAIAAGHTLAAVRRSSLVLISSRWASGALRTAIRGGKGARCALCRRSGASWTERTAHALEAVGKAVGVGLVAVRAWLARCGQLERRAGGAQRARSAGDARR